MYPLLDLLWNKVKTFVTFRRKSSCSYQKSTIPIKIVGSEIHPVRRHTIIEPEVDEGEENEDDIEGVC